MARYISIDQCPHGVLCVSLDHEGGGTKLTQAKCCGRWTSLRRWTVDASQLRNMAIELECAAEELEREDGKTPNVALSGARDGHDEA